MTDEEKVAHLTQMLDEPEGKYTHVQIQGRLAQLQKPRPMSYAEQQARTHTPDEGNVQPDYLPAPKPRPGVWQGLAGLGKLALDEARSLPGSFRSVAQGGPKTDVLSTQPGRRRQVLRGVDDSVTLGYGQQAADAIGRGVLRGAANAATFMAEGHPDDFTAKLLAHGLGDKPEESLSGTAADDEKAYPRERVGARAAATFLPGATKYIAETGMGLAGGLGAPSSGLAGAGRGVLGYELAGPALAGAHAESKGHRLESARDAATDPVGLIASGAFGAAGDFARARRAATADIQKLDEYGLEPGPIPGRPVIQKDKSILRQAPGIGEPALGVSRATPATRGEASRAAADQIVPDIEMRRHLNNQQFGPMQQKAYLAQGHRPILADPILGEIQAHLADASLPDSTRTALQNLHDRIQSHGQPASGGGVAVSAQKFDELRDYADSLARQEAAVKAKDVPLRQVSDMMRKEVAQTAPQIGIVNAVQHDMLNGIEEREALLGMKKSRPRGPAGREAAAETAARRIRQSGEETGTRGIRTSGGQSVSERLADMGPPPILPGATPGPAPNYRALLDVPRLQLAQENLQLLPSKVFSGGGKPSGTGMISRYASFIPDRLMYPIGRRAGETITPVVGLEQIARNRGSKKRQREQAP